MHWTLRKAARLRTRVTDRLSPTVRGVSRLFIAGAAAGVVCLAHAESPNARDQSLRYGPRVYGDRPTVEQMLSLGRKIFFDPELSASGSMSCATCHSPHRAFAPANELPVQLGGPDMSRPGMRNPPSLKIMAT